MIFVSGCFWHMHDCGRCRIPASRRDYWIHKLERNAARDQRVQRTLRRQGWGVMLIWECQTRPSKAAKLPGRIIRFLDN